MLLKGLVLRGITWEVVRNANSQVPSQTYEPDTGSGCTMLALTSPPGDSDAQLKSDSHWPRLFSFAFITPSSSVTCSNGLFHPPWLIWASCSYPCGPGSLRPVAGTHCCNRPLSVLLSSSFTAPSPTFENKLDYLSLFRTCLVVSHFLWSSNFQIYTLYLAYLSNFTLS